MICDLYAHLGTFQKQHKNQNIFQSPHIFQLFLPKQDRLYKKAISQSYFRSSRSDMSEPNHFFSRNLLWAYASQIPRLCIVRHCIIDRNYSKNTDRVNIMNPKHLITLKWHDFQWPTIPQKSIILMQAFKEFLLPFHTLLLTPSKQKLVN